MKIEQSLNESIDLEERSPTSSKLFTKLSIISSLIALLMFFGCAIMYQINHTLGLNAFAAVLIPKTLLLIISLYLGIAERLRGKYMGAVIALLLCVALTLAIISVFVFELAVYGEVFIAPFNPPPTLNA